MHEATRVRERGMRGAGIPTIQVDDPGAEIFGCPFLRLQSIQYWLPSCVGRSLSESQGKSVLRVEQGGCMKLRMEFLGALGINLSET